VSEVSPPPRKPKPACAACGKPEDENLVDGKVVPLRKDAYGGKVCAECPLEVDDS
jgi:hypothetical protein